jgi:hypothetical protein
MKRISLELNATLNKKLKQYACDHYESPYGKQEDILRDALVEFLNTHGTAQQQVEEIKKNQATVLQSKFQPAAPPASAPTHSTEPAPSALGASAEPATSAVGASAEPKAKRVKKPPKSGAITDEDDAKIRVLLASGIDNMKEIARQIGHEDQYQTVLRHIDKIKKIQVTDAAYGGARKS